MRKASDGKASAPAATAERSWEKAHRALARRAAEEGIVLLKNDGCLPLFPRRPVALFGSGATQTVKGGTGSGDVNERESVSIRDGMKRAGFKISNEAWLEEYERLFSGARRRWRDEILEAAKRRPGDPGALVDAYVRRPFARPVGRLPRREELCGADTAIFVLSRQAGEGMDRRPVEGDYLWSPEETAFLRELRKFASTLIVVLNCGAPVDLRILDQVRVNGLLLVSQAGMEGGSALAEILAGRTAPSGKLTATWAERYEDYPGATEFDAPADEKERYHEGIYMGYRYFDTFGVKPRLPFGYGLSYTEFSIAPEDAAVEPREGERTRIALRVTVHNRGKRYAGRQVVQVYAACPDGTLKKERKRLCAFGKTPMLSPGEACRMKLSFSVEQLASFSGSERAFLLEAGVYRLLVGDCSDALLPAGQIVVPEKIPLRRTEPVCPPREPLEEYCPPETVWDTEPGGPVLRLLVGDCGVPADVPEPPFLREAAGLAETLSERQLLALTSGDPGKGQDSAGTFGDSGRSVPGAAGETSDAASGPPWKVPPIVLADGPAGLRLAQAYQVTAEGTIRKPTFVESIERGFFAARAPEEGEETRFQYCTAFPVGTMLAQTWDPELLERIGRAVAEEMREFHVTLWLAPGMNLQRNPLCGRNFEYFSEDPLLSGCMAAALTRGVQSIPGTGTTIKHFACNNREQNRRASDSVVSERALRELYLRGFEIAVKDGRPMAVMSSYNLLNGVHTANSRDLLTRVLREEWGFDGFVMTDWTTTGDGGSSPVLCMKAGNDLIMPGAEEDLALLREALHGEGGETLTEEEVRRCVRRLIRVILEVSPEQPRKPYGRGRGTPVMTAETELLENEKGETEHV